MISFHPVTFIKGVSTLSQVEFVINNTPAMFMQIGVYLMASRLGKERCGSDPGKVPSDPGCRCCTAAVFEGEWKQIWR
jgi:hypothetical protein